MIGERGFTNNAENQKKIPEFILAAIRKANEAISIGAAVPPENEDQYVDMILKNIPSAIRAHDEELKSQVKKIINEKNIGKVVRKSDPRDSDEHGKSIEYMIQQGGEAPPETRNKYGDIRPENTEVKISTKQSSKNSLTGVIHKKGAYRHLKELGVKDEENDD